MDFLKFGPLDYKTIVVIIIIGLFYFRLYTIRERKRREERLLNHKLRSQGKKSPNPYSRPRYQVSSWFIIVPAILLMLFGLTITSTNLLPVALKPYDWIFIAAGGILFIFSFK
jgi:hypothetical protein